MSVSIWDAVHSHPVVRFEWRRSPGSVARRARDSVAPFRRRSAGWMPARMGKSAGVGRRHPVTVRKAPSMTGSMRQVWALRHQTGAQHSAVDWTRAKVAVRNVVDPEPQPEPPSHIKSATRDVSLLRNDSRCRWYVSVLSNATLAYLGSEQKGKVSLLWFTLSSRWASLLFRQTTANTVCLGLSFSFQIWRYSPSVAMSLS